MYLVRFVGGPDGDSGPTPQDELPDELRFERWLSAEKDDYGPGEYDESEPLPTGPRCTLYALVSRQPTADERGREVWTYEFTSGPDDW